MSAKPFTKEEWQEMMSMTLHGPLPQKTLYRVYATVDALMLQKEELEKLLRKYAFSIGLDSGLGASCIECGSPPHESHHHGCKVEELLGKDDGSKHWKTSDQFVKRGKKGCPGCGYTFKGHQCPRCGGE
ncbi:MAG: hypothetical protein ACTSW7_00855 [Candidatus Thorarchaeota archaeon]|nr:hypothetical protein [Thermoplasmatales archaeon]